MRWAKLFNELQMHAQRVQKGKLQKIFYIARAYFARTILFGVNRQNYMDVEDI